MERYYSYGEKSNPEFPHRVKVKEVSDEMLHWCSVYRPVGVFDRYYVEWPGAYNQSQHAIFQFETETPALLFKLKYGDQ